MADEFEPRRARPNQRFTWNDAEGTVELTADAEGVLQPRNERENAAADGFGLPVARKVVQEQRAATREREG